MDQPAPSATPILRSQVLLSGHSDADIRKRRQNGTWSAVRRGGYIATTALTPLDAVERHELLVRATVPGLRIPAVVSHCSAAVMLGIPLWSTPLRTVHLTRHPPARTGRSATLLVHAAQISDDEVCSVDGFLITDPTRTITDLARSLPFEQAVVAADAALHRGLTSRERMAEAVEKLAGRPGSRALARVVRFADGRSESVGESRSRVMMFRAGLPQPVLQFSVSSADGKSLGRSDFAWRQGRVLGEFDGFIKYGRLLEDGETAGDVVVREKVREDALRDNGSRVVRWYWDELRQPAAVIQRIRRALAATKGE